MNGTLVFIKDASGTASTTKSNTTNISGNGFYYYVSEGEGTGKGTWVFYVMVTPKGTIKYYETTTSMDAKNTHDIALPNGFK